LRQGLLAYRTIIIMATPRMIPTWGVRSREEEVKEEHWRRRAVQLRVEMVPGRVVSKVIVVVIMPYPGGEPIKQSQSQFKRLTSRQKHLNSTSRENARYVIDFASRLITRQEDTSCNRLPRTKPA